MNTGGTSNTGIHKGAQDPSTGHTTARSDHSFPSACHVMTAIHVTATQCVSRQTCSSFPYDDHLET